MGMDLTIFAVHIMGASSIMGSINIITTILNLRAPGMTLMKMPLFCWTWLITAYLLIAVMPVLAGAVTMLLTDRHFGTSFFNAAGGGDPVLFQHIFWFFGHPEVYIIILPAFGIISRDHPGVLAQAAVRLRVDGLRDRRHRDPVVHRLGAPHVHRRHAGGGHAVLHVRDDADRGADRREGVQLARDDVEGLDDLRDADAVRRSASCSCSRWAASPAWCCAITPIDIQLQDTYYVVAHFHYVMVAGALFAFFGGVYYWLPKWTGTMYDEKLGKWHFWLSMIFFNITFFPMHFLGPRRHAAAHPRLRAAVRRLEHGGVDRRVRLRPVAAHLPVRR